MYATLTKKPLSCKPALDVKYQMVHRKGECSTDASVVLGQWDKLEVGKRKQDLITLVLALGTFASNSGLRLWLAGVPLSRQHPEDSYAGQIRVMHPIPCVGDCHLHILWVAASKGVLECGGSDVTLHWVP